MKPTLVLPSLKPTLVGLIGFGLVWLGLVGGAAMVAGETFFLGEGGRYDGSMDLVYDTIWDPGEFVFRAVFYQHLSFVVGLICLFDVFF